MPKHSQSAVPSPNSRWSELDARAVLAGWQASGLPMAAYARSRGFHAQRLAWWSKRLSGWSTALEPAGRLVPAEIVAAPRLATGAPGVVRLPRGVVVEVPEASPAWVAALVAELEALA